MKTISKILSIVLCLAMVMALFVVGASADTTKNVVAAGTSSADFSALVVDGTNDNSYAASRTSKDGWTATNAALSTDWPAGVKAVILNGKTTASGTLTTGTLTGPLKTISFKYGFPYSDTQFKLTINVKQNGQVVATKVLEKTGLSKTTEYNFTWDLDTAVTGDFTLEFVNNCKSNSSSSNKDRLAIWGLTWSGTSGAVHTHDGEATSVVHDAEQHWTVYACGELKDEKANHTYVNGVCSFAGCGQKQPVIVNAEKVTSIADGDKIVIYYAAEQLAISPVANNSKLTGVKATVTGNELSAGDPLVLEVKKSGDQYSFLYNGKYLSTKDQAGNGLIFVDAPSDYTVWTLEAADEGFYIKSVNAKYTPATGDPKPQYFEYYNSNFTTYSFNTSNTAIYTFQFFKVVEADDNTGNEGTGNEGTGNEGGNTTTPEAPKPFVPSTGVDTPVAGTAFKLGLYQKNVEKYLYFNNTTPSADRPYYQGTTDKFAEAVDVFVEAVEGGYKLYFMDGTTKTYIDIYQSGTYVNLRLTTEPTAVFTWNTEHKTFVTKIGEDDYYIGTYSTFETISACKLSKIADSFASHLYAKEPAKTGDNSVISVAVAAAVLSIMGAAVLVSKKKEF